MRPGKKEYGAVSFWPGGKIGTPGPFDTQTPLSKAQLSRLRDEFFETRTEGHLEMWAAIRSAAHAQEAGDDELAYAIIQATAIIPAEVGPDKQGLGERIPRSEQGCGYLFGALCGCIWQPYKHYRTLERVYDPHGFLYEVPKECIATPANLVRDESWESPQN